MSTSSTTRTNTAQRMLDTAEALVQVRGFNGFSYADVADELHVTKATLHYHFRSKAELGHALITRYAARFADALREIDREIPTAPQMLHAYVGLYKTVLERNRMCLCGILAAEYQTLPGAMREAITGFFEDNERLADRCSGPWSGRRQRVDRRTAPRHRTDDRERTRGGDARRPHARRT